MELHFKRSEEIAGAFGGGRFSFRLNLGAHEYIRCNASEQLKTAKRAAWSYILEHAGLFALMSDRKRTEVQQQIEKGTIPDFTTDNIVGLLVELSGQIGDLTTEAIKEAFEILRPHSNEHKTNSQYEVGRKVIMTYWLHRYGYDSRPHFNYGVEGKINSVDNAFHLLDSKGPIKQDGTGLLDAIRAAERDQTWRFETPYFRGKIYMNSNLHMEILRDDLRAKLNQIGGGNALKHDTTAHRQAV
jgi:hypothetical protein